MNDRDLHYLKKNSILNGRYIITGVLGEGGFGITYIGVDELFGSQVALKEFYPQGIVVRNSDAGNSVSVTYSNQNDAFINGKKRFISEAKVMARFRSSPGIVHVTDFFEANNTAYIVMEYLDGITLKNYIKSNGRMDAEDLLSLMVPLLETLDEVHKAGLIHRDISPDNIMILANGEVKLMDFGAARDYTGFGENSLSIILKPGYAPAEQYQTRGIQGPWTDIYALCATMYWCITGVVPEDSIDRVMDDRLKKPSDLGIKIPDPIEKALMRGMSVPAKERYQNLRDLCDDLYSSYYQSEDLASPESDSKEALKKNEDQKEPIPETVIKNDVSFFAKYRNLIIAACALLVFFSGYLIYQKSLERKVPDLVGVSYEKAQEMAGRDDDSLILDKSEEEYSDTVDKGNIISQSEEPGTVLKKGDHISVVVSKGALVKVPDVTGKSYKKAEKLMVDSRLVINKSDSEWSDKVKKDYVISQSVKAGEKIGEGETVDVVVSKGVEQVEVPDVIGKTLEEAKQLLKDSKLKCDSEKKYSSKVNEGNVISQSVDAGKTVTKNKTIKVVISKGPKPETSARVTFAVNNSGTDHETDHKTVKSKPTVYVHFTMHDLDDGQRIQVKYKIINPFGLEYKAKMTDSDGDDFRMGNGDIGWVYWKDGLSPGKYTFKVLENNTEAVIGTREFTVE